MARVILTRRVRTLRGLLAAATALLTLGCLTAISLYFLNDSRRRAQMQTDPRVATVWMLGVTYGKQHTLTRGSTLQQWLNAHGFHGLGDYRVLTSRYSGDPGSLEIWFDYQSFLPNHSLLECHRIGETAFVDDLDQPYHGYLDIHDKYVGVYLPGYDHAARRILCAVHWMPRQPAPPHPVSAPMVFTIDLPPAPRLLPPANTLPHGPISVSNQGITATVSEARLSAPNLSGLSGGQRELTFRLKIQGGELANSNVELPPTLTSVSAGQGSNHLLLYWYRNQIMRTRRPRSGIAQLFRPFNAPRATITPTFPGGFASATAYRPLTITDPYGISLLPDSETLSPLQTLEENDARNAGRGTVWVAPVNGAGHGTDVIRLHFDVLPAKAASSTQPVPFDIMVPVQTGDEV
ncbi:MAG TPA: hypothetical protein VFB38_25215 [Chthonomonadaceae bacterium]|nr:hypothetical protein [Chthonomonadaceae bacterium]